MLEIKDILMGAHSDSPALNDFCKVVASRLPHSDLTVREMAQIVLNTSFDVRKNVTEFAAEYPQLCKFVESKGDMCQLSAKVLSVLEEGAADSESEPYVEAYRIESKLFFGSAV